MYEIHDTLEISATMRGTWQKVVDLMAECLHVPAGLVMRVHQDEIEVLVRSSNPENVYHVGERAELNTGLYCETVMSSGRELVVPDACVDPAWANNPDIKLGMISYCGLPLTWPDGRIFGTICVLDATRNDYGQLYRRLLAQFRECIQLGLQTLFENQRLQEAQLALMRAREAAEAANRAKTVFLSTMSHELRTPMNAIVGMTGLALLSATDAKLVTRLRTIEGASAHLLQVINDVLEISKIESEHISLVCEDFKLPSVIGRVRSLTSEQAIAKHLDLTFELEDPLENMTLRGDPLRLAQILVNYVGNAIKFTAAGSISVRARIVEQKPGEVLLRCEVKDSGIGIAAADQSRLFKAFVQADEYISSKFGGTGLGLAISMSLAKLMRGDVGVVSASGQGSTFWFTAWLQTPAPMAETASLEDAQSAEERLRSRHAGSRVLLAEDDVVNRCVAQELLAHVKIGADEASDGQVALELARRHRYDIILMDIQMPVLGGIEAAKAIRALPEHADTPILAFSASAFEEDRRAFLDAGMNDHISKPVTPQAFFESLLKWLEPPASRRAD